MYWFDILDILGEHKGERLSSTEVILLLKKKHREINSNRVTKMLLKLYLKHPRVQRIVISQDKSRDLTQTHARGCFLYFLE